MKNEEKVENSQETFDGGPKVNFPQFVKIEPCSYNECKNGHKFPPQLAIGQCPGCQGPILAVNMVNCPICNEPVDNITLRTDHTKQGMGIPAVCRQQRGLSEVVIIKLKRNHADEAVEKWDEATGRMVV